MEKTYRAQRDLTTRIATFRLTITIRPSRLTGELGRPGLRSVTLYTNPANKPEPISVLPTGKPTTASALISREDVRGLVALFAASGFFEFAEKYYDSRGPVDPLEYPPPDEALPYNSRYLVAPDQRGGRLPPNQTGYTVQISDFDDHWFTYYEANLAWSKDRPNLLDSIRIELAGEAEQLMLELTNELRARL